MASPVSTDSVRPPTSPRPRRPRLHEQVVRGIVQEVVTGGFTPGEPLPSEAELAQRFNVSRAVIREAIRVLVAKGLVLVRHGRGMWLQPPERWDHLDPLLLFEQVRSRRDTALLDELLEVRRLVEVEVAALAAQRRTAGDLEALGEAVAGMRQSLHDPDTYTHFDNLFHDAILAAARNRLLRQALEPVFAVLKVGRFLSIRQPGAAEKSMRAHEAIYAAIAQGEVMAARRAMRQHIQESEADLRAALCSEQIWERVTGEMVPGAGVPLAADGQEC